MSKNASIRVVIRNKLGLHARPAMLFVETATRCECEISVRRTDDQDSVDGKSIMQLMMLAATHGTEIEICATGNGAKQAVESLATLVHGGFQED